MSLPPPHGTSLGLWTVKHKIKALNLVVLEKQNVGKTVFLPVTDEEFEYLVEGQVFNFSATQP